MDSVDERINGKPIIFFDGICTLCNKSINFLMQNDTRKKLYYASLQSELFQEISKKYNISGSESVVFLNGGKVYSKSRAILEIAKCLSGVYLLLYPLILIPPFVRNVMYDLVANNRYRWFGKATTCRVPTKEERSRFLE